MKRRFWCSALLLLACGCSSMNNTESGAVGGGLLGAGIGTLFGLACHHPLAGAAIGGAVGAGTGALVGNAEDHAEKRQAIAQANAVAVAQDAASRAPTLPDIVSMTQHNVSEANIIYQIRNSGAYYALTAQDINYLRDNGVSATVIAELQRPPAQRVYVQEVRPVYVADPYYPPPSVGIGFGYRRW